MSQYVVLDQIVVERKEQDKKWGKEHDAAHTTAEWIQILDRLLDLIESKNYLDNEVLRADVLKMAAVCVAWLEIGSLK